MQLVEEGKLKLDDQITTHLRPQLDLLDSRIEELQITNGVKYGQLLTIRHLLTHRSGVPDYWSEKPTFGSQKDKSIVDVIFTDVESVESRAMNDGYWKPVDILGYFVENQLSTFGKFKPGEGFHYSDTNCLLLGLAIENVSILSRSLPRFHTTMTRPTRIQIVYNTSKIRRV